MERTLWLFYFILHAIRNALYAWLEIAESDQNEGNGQTIGNIPIIDKI